MTRRELVKAAIQHRETGRCPYSIDICGDAWDALKPKVAAQSPDQFLDNDVQAIGVPWWGWGDLAADWKGADTPKSLDRIVASGNYDGLADRIKAERDKSDKYFLVLIYGSHFEKAYFARGFENCMADMGRPRVGEEVPHAHR